MKFRKAPVSYPWLYKASKDPRVKFETTCKFNKPTVERTYVKVLVRCMDTYATAKDLFPHTEHAIMKQTRDMCRQGLLQRYKKAGSRTYYYKTTNKGKNLVINMFRQS